MNYRHYIFSVMVILTIFYMSPVASSQPVTLDELITWRDLAYIVWCVMWDGTAYCIDCF